MKTALVDYRNSSQLPLLLSEAEKISEPSQIVYFELSGDRDSFPFPIWIPSRIYLRANARTWFYFPTRMMAASLRPASPACTG